MSNAADRAREFQRVMKQSGQHTVVNETLGGDHAYLTIGDLEVLIRQAQSLRAIAPLAANAIEDYADIITDPGE